MITFIIRRLLTAIFLLIVVSMITFGIFFLIPRLAGQNAYELATQYVGRNPTRSAVLQMEAKLGLNESLPVQYWHFLSGIVAGAHYNDGPATIPDRKCQYWTGSDSLRPSFASIWRTVDLVGFRPTYWTASS